MTTTTSKRKIHYGYVVVVGLCLLMIPSAFLSNTAGIFYAPVSKDLGVSMTAYSFTSSLQLYVLALTVLFLGKVISKYDSRITLTATIILQALCYFLNSRATSLTMFYIDHVLLGLCHCMMIYLCVPVFVNKWFSIRIGTMLGIAGACQGLGAVLFNTIGSAIIANYGWRACFITWSIVTLIIGLPVTLCMIRLNPEEKGEKPVGYEQSLAAAVSSEGVKELGIKAKVARRTGIFWIACSASMAIGAADTFNYYLHSYALSIGVGTVMAGTAASAVMLGNMFGKIATGAIQDKNPYAGALFGAGCPTVAFLLVLLLAKRFLWIVWVGSFLFGIGYGATNVISPELVRRTFGKKDFASLWSIVASAQTIACAVGTTFWGLIVENAGYSVAMVLVSLFTLWTVIGSIITYSKSKEWQAKWTE